MTAVGCAQPASPVSAAFALHGAPADVEAAEALRPVDLAHCLVGERLRLRHGAAARGHVQDAPAIREEPAVEFLRSGMEDVHAFGVPGPLDTADRRALLDRAR